MLDQKFVSPENDSTDFANQYTLPAKRYTREAENQLFVGLIAAHDLSQQALQSIRGVALAAERRVFVALFLADLYQVGGAMGLEPVTSCLIRKRST